DFSLVGVERVFDALYGLSFERLTFLEQFADALRISTIAHADALQVTYPSAARRFVCIVEPQPPRTLGIERTGCGPGRRLRAAGCRAPRNAAKVGLWRRFAFQLANAAFGARGLLLGSFFGRLLGRFPLLSHGDGPLCGRLLHVTRKPGKTKSAE